MVTGEWQLILYINFGALGGINGWWRLATDAIVSSVYVFYEKTSVLAGNLFWLRIVVELCLRS